MEDTLPWDTAAHLPWQGFMNPTDQWQVMPSFLIGEYVVIACAVAALVHALQKGRGHLLIWLAALIAGTANDMIFMALPLVDNFWQGQATIMITPRLPLYIPCMYVVFMYYPTVAVRRLGLPRWSAAALTGLLACMFYAPYDIVGAKFLWWTWHDTDAPTAARILGAPVGSSLWVLTFVGAFSYLLDRVLRGSDQITARTFLKGFTLVAGLSTLLMMVQITALQQLDGGAPGYLAFGSGLAIYAFVAARGRKHASPTPLAADPLGSAMPALYLLMLVVVMAVFDPATHVSAGLHQPPGPCYVETTDITGVTRHKYLCARDFDEDYSFACATAPADGAEWYTICGQAHTSFPAWMGGVAGLGTVGMLGFLYLFGLLARGRAAEVQPTPDKHAASSTPNA